MVSGQPLERHVNMFLTVLQVISFGFGTPLFAGSALQQRLAEAQLDHNIHSFWHVNDGSMAFLTLARLVICSSLCIYVLCILVFVHVHVHVHVHVPVHVLVRAREHVSLHLRVNMYYVCKCLCLCMCMFVCVCLSVCVCVSMCRCIYV